MLHISDLHENILALILLKAASPPASTLSEWRTKLPLLAVCQEWTELAQTAVFSQVLVEYIYKPCSTSDTAENAESRNVSREWASNANLLIARGCYLMAKSLVFNVMGYLAPDDILRMSSTVLCLDKTDWCNIQTVAVAKSPMYYRFMGVPMVLDESATSDLASAVQLFAKNMCNVLELDIGNHRDDVAGNHFFSSLVSLYHGRLQMLRIEHAIPLHFTELSNITVLEICMDSDAARVLPSANGETLVNLRLLDVPTNFAWHHFRYNSSVRPIVFERLVILLIEYGGKESVLSESEVQRKVIAGASNCDQLHFPELKKLGIGNCTPDCDLLYMNHPFPNLDLIELVGPFDKLRHCCRLKLPWVDTLTVVAEGTIPHDDIKVYNAFNHFFSGICIGEKAVLSFQDSDFNLDPGQLCLNNLTDLVMHSSDYAALCKFISRLPSLRRLELLLLNFNSEPLSSLFDTCIQECKATHQQTWAAKLVSLAIFEVNDECPIAVSTYGVQLLILHARAIRELAVPSSIELFITAFVNAYQHDEPHLALIQLIAE